MINKKKKKDENFTKVDQKFGLWTLDFETFVGLLLFQNILTGKTKH
jgi:hypothetical protein